MPWGIVAGAAIGAIGSMSAASTQAGAQEQAAATQQQMFSTITGQEQPFLTAGTEATSALDQLLGLSPSTGPKGTAAGTGLPANYLTQTFNPTAQQLENYPGYQFQLQQGDLALQSANAPTGGALSGATLKQLSSFNQGLAASNYQNYFNQFQTQQTNIFDRLAGIASLGQNAAGNLGNTGAQLGSGIAQAQAAAGGSMAGGIVGASNSASNAATLYALLGNQNDYSSVAPVADAYGNAATTDVNSQVGYPTAFGGS